MKVGTAPRKKISDTELKKNDSVGIINENIYYINQLKQILKGSTIEQLSKENNLSPGTIKINITKALYHLMSEWNEPIPPQFLDNPYEHRDFWYAALKRQEIINMLKNPITIEGRFFQYFKKLSYDRQTELLKHLENALNFTT